MEQTVPMIGTTLTGSGDRARELDDLDEVFRLHRSKVFRFVLFSVRDDDVAETLTQDCFLKAYNARSSFRGDCSVTTWLMQIAMNLVRDHARNRRLQFWKRAATVDVAEMSDVLGDGSASAERQLLAREQVRGVWQAVEKLSASQRSVFLLRFVDEMELKAISVVMGMKESTVKTHLYRALAAVRAEMGGAQ
jgi:RNA polymerase sigma-70 factor (ECF subfamily)